MRFYMRFTECLPAGASPAIGGADRYSLFRGIWSGFAIFRPPPY